MNDLKFAFRQLLKNPGFTAVAVLTLALGIGANTAIFSVVNAVLLRPLPFKDPGRLVTVWGSDIQHPQSKGGVSYPDFSEWRERSRTFEQWAAWYTWDYTVTGGEEPFRVRGAVVSRELFDLLGVPPKLGRLIGAEEDKPGHRMVLLSESLWQRRFSSDPDLPGQNITLNGDSYIVAGIMPFHFHFPLEADAVEVWTTILMTADPGEEVQVDFGTGPTLLQSDGKKRKTWIFRLVLSYSRKAYSQAVLRQDTETFLRCIEAAFREFGGSTLTINLDNLNT